MPSSSPAPASYTRAAASTPLVTVVFARAPAALALTARAAGSPEPPGSCARRSGKMLARCCSAAGRAAGCGAVPNGYAGTQGTGHWLQADVPAQRRTGQAGRQPGPHLLRQGARAPARDRGACAPRAAPVSEAPNLRQTARHCCAQPGTARPALSPDQRTERCTALSPGGGTASVFATRTASGPRRSARQGASQGRTARAGHAVHAVRAAAARALGLLAPRAPAAAQGPAVALAVNLGGRHSLLQRGFLKSHVFYRGRFGRVGRLRVRTSLQARDCAELVPAMAGGAVQTRRQSPSAPAWRQARPAATAQRRLPRACPWAPCAPAAKPAPRRRPRRRQPELPGRSTRPRPAARPCPGRSPLSAPAGGAAACRVAGMQGAACSVEVRAQQGRSRKALLTRRICHTGPG